MACRTIADIANNFHIGTDKTNKLAKQDIWLRPQLGVHCSDVIMSVMASQVTDVSIVYLTVGSGTEQKKLKLRVTGLCEGNSPVTGEFPVQRSGNVENVSI